jgi:hypothetical protein
MQGLNQKVARIFHQGNHYIVPGYQRDYQWNEARWQSLVSDILHAVTNGPSDPDHWLGILLTSSSTDLLHPGFSGQMDFLVIDGQQRLTTLSIWISALVHHAEEQGTPIDFDLTKMAKITVQASDHPFYEAALGNKWRDKELFAERNRPILKAYFYFRYLLWHGQNAVAESDPVKIPKLSAPNSEVPFEEQWLEGANSRRGSSLPRSAAVDTLALLTSTLHKLSIFALMHDQTADESQAVIFDTLNGKRTELEPLDHVRNSLFVRIQDLELSELYSKYWMPAETLLRDIKVQNMKAGMAFIYDYVISKGEKGKQKSISAVRGASHFAIMMKRLNPVDIPMFIQTDMVPSMLTWAVVQRVTDSVTINKITRKFPDESLQIMTNIRELSAGPANPVVLHYARGWLTGRINDRQLHDALFLIENYLVRQVLAGKASQPLRSRLMDLMGHVGDDYTYSKLVEGLTRDWVSDSTIRDMARSLKLYETTSARSIAAILRGIERYLSGFGYNAFKYGVGKGFYTIEHICPQDNKQWRDDLESWGVDLELMKNKVHTIGNLTVVTHEHNSAVGNSKFHSKQEFPTNIGAGAPMKLNLGWLAPNVREWTPAEIDARSLEMVNVVTSYWKSI